MKGPRRARRRFVLMGLFAAGSLIWLLLRTGEKPSRITYPCQRAAVGNIHVFLLALVMPLAGFLKHKVALPRVNPRLFKVTLLAASLVLALGFGTITTTPETPVQLPFLPETTVQSRSSSTGPSNLFVVQNASGADGNADLALATLLQLMGNHGLFFFQTASTPSGLIGEDDVVIIKVNCQWSQRGGTNTDLVKSLIQMIVGHPEGFSGEIIIADNGQGRGSLSWVESNAFDHSQSMVEVAHSFSPFHVSTWLWDTIRNIVVDDYDQGDFSDGYVVNFTQNPVTELRVSYPKFQTVYGTYISFKNGVWNAGSGSFSSEKLKVINVPVLKSHSVYGVTGCVKHYMGVVSQPLAGTHSVIGYGALGEEMAETKFPTLNILDCLWVNANPKESSSDCGPSTSYGAASFTDTIAASTDPVALEYWASKHVLLPAAIEKGYTLYSSLDPDYEPVTSGLIQSYHTYLERSMNQLRSRDFQVTMNETEMNVFSALPGALLGDVDGDRDVDIFDIVRIASIYGAVRPEPPYDWRCDLDLDGNIDIFDVVVAAGSYGETW